jgi:signal transduction histidine kinase/ligand-binding sensor domain-containing protein
MRDLFCNANFRRLRLDNERIYQHHLWSVLATQLECLAARGRHSHYIHVGLKTDKAAEPLPQKHIVIKDQNSTLRSFHRFDYRQHPLPAKHRIGVIVSPDLRDAEGIRVQVISRMAAVPRQSGVSHPHGFVRLLIVFLLCCARLRAIDPNQPITQMHHTAWSAKEGVLGEVLAIAQTKDGFIWIGTTGGLLHFDGSVLERYTPEEGSYPEPCSVSALLATSDGGVWIGYLGGGASFLDCGRVRNYSENEGMPRGRIHNFAQDIDGTIWAAAAGGLGHFDGRTWQHIGKNENPWGLPTDSPASVAVSREGLWVSASNEGVFFLPRGASAFQEVMPGPVPGYLSTFTVAGEDSMWLWVPELLSVQRFPVRVPAGDRPSQGIANSAGMFLVDRDGGAWMMTRHDGVWRVPVADRIHGRVSRNDPSIEKFSVGDGLTNATVYCAMEDREGDVWAGTLGGLDRFRPRNAAWIELQPVATQRMQLVAGDRGEVWASSPQGLWNARDGKPVRRSPAAIQFSFRDPDGAIGLWSEQSDGGDLWRWSGGQFLKALSPSLPFWKNAAADLWVSIKGPVRALTRDGSGELWVSIRGGGVFRQHDGVWSHIEILKGEPYLTAYGAICDGQGRVWLAYPERREIARWDHGAVRMFSAENGLNVGAVTQITYADGQVWAGGESGLAVYSEDGFHTVETEGGEDFGMVAGIAGAPESGLWLSTPAEIVHIPQNEVSLVVQDWRHKVQYKTFDPISDLAEKPSDTSDTPAVMGTDGVLWFATPRGIILVDPAHLHRNLTPPQVAIRKVIANGKSYSVYAPVLLPAHTTNLRIGYSVLSFPIPERVRSRYRLQGFDTEWRDAGGRVDTVNKNLGPGRYTFLVQARNNDGVWNEAGASLNLAIQPAFYQTVWFQFFYVLAGVALIWLLYRLRLRQMTARVQLRYAERLAERTRIARELHDTLLQTIQGSKLVAANALKNAYDPIRTRRALEQLSEWLVRATDEGRAALHSLRTSTIETNDLAAGLRRALEDCRREPSMEAIFNVNGDAREMHPIVRDEIYLIGYEAIRNAHAHSAGSRIDATLTYAGDLSLSVRDNGIGIDSLIAEAGRDGHFGLPSMRERAARIGAD